MIAPARKTLHVNSDWQQAFLLMLPTMLRHFRLAFRFLRPEAKAEAIQEATANACVAYQRLAAQGRTERAYPTVLANFAVRQVNDGRRVGTSRNIRDAFSEVARRQGRIVLERLDHFDTVSEEWQEAVVEDHHTAVIEQVWFRIDFPQWLATLRPRDSKISKALAVGNSTGEVAKKFGVSAGRVSQLRRELYASWNEFLGEAQEPPA